MIALLISAEKVIVYDVEHGSIAPVGSTDPEALAAAFGRVLQVRPPTSDELDELRAFEPVEVALEPWVEDDAGNWSRQVDDSPDDTAARVYLSTHLAEPSWVARAHCDPNVGETMIGLFADLEEAKIACDLAWATYLEGRKPERLDLDQIRKLTERMREVSQ